VLVKTFFSELRWFWISHSNWLFISLVWIVHVSIILDPLVNVMRQIHSCLMKQTLPCLCIEFRSKEVCFCTTLLSFFQSKLYLKTWLQYIEVRWDPEMPFESSRVKAESGPKNEWSRVAFPHCKAFHPWKLIKVFVVMIKFLLGIYVL